MNHETMRGCVHIYCGDGKGKTSAAVGLAVRAAGRGRRVLITRFLKNDDSGEVAVLASIEGIDVMPCEKDFGFFSRMSEAEKEQAGRHYRQMFGQACRMAEKGCCDVLILDEMMAACNYNLVPEAQVTDWIAHHRPLGMELVLTGRNPSERLMELADYISVVQMEKHPFQKGLPARRGIEY